MTQTTERLTHSELCILACRWLAKKKLCKHVFAEPQSMNLSEFPDAIGYRAGTYPNATHVIEVKVSVEDFKRDKNKGWRRFEKAGMGYGNGMGAHRWYLVPDGLVPESDVPPDHGLLYAKAKGKVAIVREAPIRESRDVPSELSWLGTALDRWKAGVPWVPNEYRFETMTETKRRTSPEQRMP